MTHLRLLITSLFIAFFITACGGGGTNSSVSSNVTKILAIGDSIGNGFGGTNPWPRIIQSESGVAVINNSVNGRQASGIASIVRSDIELHKPSHLIIMLGTNDANNGSISGAVNSIRQAIAIAQAANVIPIIGTVPPIPADSGASARARSISAQYRSLGVAIAEIEGAFGNNAALFQADRFHPNNEGQVVIANAFLNVL
jgi:lysophospholipase L1-like esterase